jgi:hypothetical protein
MSSKQGHEFRMQAMYGNRRSDPPYLAVSAAGGVRTPTLLEFKLANGLGRHSHRISWCKRL